MTGTTSNTQKYSHKAYALINAIVLALVIWWNYYSNTGNIGGKTVGELSAEYDNYFTPAGYAFAIWGLIYLALTAQAVFFIVRAFDRTKESTFLSQIGPYLIIANIFNAGWLWFWLTENTGLSVVTMLGILLCLVIVILSLRMNISKESKIIQLLVRTPISIYAGWITVATVANISAYLAKIGWSGGPIDEITWTIIMMAVAALVNISIVFLRNLYAFPLVGMWALFAISVRHSGTQSGLQGTALICMSVIFLALAFQLIRKSLLARKQTING
ncbi:hypothetical protein ACFOSV_03040 [Algoriphagus namhaensis]|uniref:Tryptophan-rich sensory protein n=1 Tax=Algoriphagus namhaensis TaxID=915353 RepID=A0ABV8AQR9_9BACT